MSIIVLTSLSIVYLNAQIAYLLSIKCYCPIPLQSNLKHYYVGLLNIIEVNITSIENQNNTSECSSD